VHSRDHRFGASGSRCGVTGPVDRYVTSSGTAIYHSCERRCAVDSLAEGSVQEAISAVRARRLSLGLISIFSECTGGATLPGRNQRDTIQLWWCVV
jgi:hypothetical protein